MKNNSFLKANVVALGLALMFAQGVRADDAETPSSVQASLMSNAYANLATYFADFKSSLTESSFGKQCGEWSQKGQDAVAPAVDWLRNNRYAVCAGVVVCLGLVCWYKSSKETTERNTDNRGDK
jgi:Flp pilus assembly protein TadB